MRGFLETAFARRTAWTTLVALAVGLLVPVSHQRAEAQERGGRTAYLVPIPAVEGIDQEVPDRITTELRSLLTRFGADARAQQPLELIPLNLRNLVIARAIEEGAITEADVTTPPTTAEAAFTFARNLGLTTVLVPTVETYTEAADKASATVDMTVTEFYVSQQPDVAPAIVRTITKAVTAKAADDREKTLLRTTVTELAARQVAAALLELPDLAPPDTGDQPTPARRGGRGSSALWIALGVVGAVALIFLASTLGGSGGGGGGAGNLTVTNVRAVSEQNAVRITWDPVAGAVGYNVFRRQVGTQPILTARRRQAADNFEVLLNPNTNSTPTVLGGGVTSFIDTTAQNGVIYEYAVAAVGPNNEQGVRSTVTVDTRTGANIGAAPVLFATPAAGAVTLRWEPSSQFADGYVIYRRQGGVPDVSLNSPDQLIRLGNVTTFRDAPLTNGVEYTYLVVPLTSIDGSQFVAGTASNPITVAAGPGAPQAPSAVTAAADSTGRVTVTWQASPDTDIDFYEILRRRDRSRSVRPQSTGRAPWLRDLAVGPDVMRSAPAERGDPRASRQVDLTNFSIVGTVDSNQTSFVDGPLPDGTYTYAVRAVNNAGQRGEAAASNTLTVNAALASPIAVRTTSLDGAVQIRWQAVSGDVTGYSIYRSNTPITAAMTSPANTPGIARVGQVGANTTFFEDRNVQNNQQYYYAVTAVDSSGLESDFGKGDSPSTGVLGVPHPAPARLEISTSAQNLAGNGQSTATITVRTVDANDNPVGGVDVTVTADRGRFINLPAGATALSTDGRQVRAFTGLNGELQLTLQSEVVQAGQLPANVQATSTELPAGQQTQSVTVNFVASVPSLIVLSPEQSQLTADNASTTNVVARVLDSLSQPVPDNTYAVDFALNTTNGALRGAGPVQNNPFQQGPATVRVPVVGGVATAVYRAGNDATILNNANIVPIQATVVQLVPAPPINLGITAQTLITLQPGTAARIEFGQQQVNLTRGTSTQVTVTVRDAQGNPVRQGQTVQFTTEPTGVVTVPASGTTDADGRIALQITAGPNPGGAVLTARIPNSQVQAQLSVLVQ